MDLLVEILNYIAWPLKLVQDILKTLLFFQKSSMGMFIDQRMSLFDLLLQRKMFYLHKNILKKTANQTN